ncbi:hypothetical protein ACQKWADRAFT_318495 [Trichoderma austrokoningii]
MGIGRWTMPSFFTSALAPLLTIPPAGTCGCRRATAHQRRPVSGEEPFTCCHFFFLSHGLAVSVMWNASGTAIAFGAPGRATGACGDEASDSDGGRSTPDAQEQAHYARPKIPSPQHPDCREPAVNG